MAQAEVTAEGRIAVTTEFTERDMIKAVPGARWDPERRTWHTPLSWGACCALRGLFGRRLVIGPQLNEWAWEERHRRIEPALALRQATSMDEVQIRDDVKAVILSWRT